MTLRASARFRVMPHCFCTFSCVSAKNTRFNVLSPAHFCTNLVNTAQFRAFFAMQWDFMCFFADFFEFGRIFLESLAFLIFGQAKIRFFHSVRLHNANCPLSVILTMPSICFLKARQKMHVIFKIEQFLLFIYCSQFVRIVGKGKACVFQYSVHLGGQKP